MCGIAGFAGFDDEALLRRMCHSITHRGPDAAGFHTEPGIGLSMRRLAIIDLKTGDQPIANETNDIWLVFNGEIYNYQTLREELKQQGHVFRTTSDTETIVHAYEQYGLEFVQHLRGMFAIALWDTKLKRLVLARDRIGEKPLYYTSTSRGLLFGSEIKTILQSEAAREVDPQAVCDFLAAGYVAGERTFYRGIQRLPPAHLLVYEHGRASVRRYWSQPSRRLELSFEDAASGLRARLIDTVAACLKSDVEVGAFLSGGIDSSLITALMCRQEAQVKTFSVGYGGAATGFNELSYAKRVATHLGTDHYELVLGAHSSIDLLPRVLWHYDEPHGEPTSVLVYLLCEYTRRKVKVALGGTAGDEIFFGYPRHRGIRMLEYYQRLPRFARRTLIERVVNRWPESTQGNRFAKRARRFIKGADLPPEEAYLSWVSLMHRDVRMPLLSSEVRAAAEDPTGERHLRDYLVHGSGSLLGRAAALDVGGYLPEYQLAYMDRMSMAHGLEVRSPLADYQLVDYALSLPDDYRLKGFTSKHILKHVATEWLPKDIVQRRKVGFDSPIGQWMKQELRGFIEEFLAPEHIQRTALLDPAAVQRVIGEHLSGARDYSLQLWSLIALEAWHRMYIEDRATGGPAELATLRGAPPAAAVSPLAAASTV